MLFKGRESIFYLTMCKGHMLGLWPTFSLRHSRPLKASDSLIGDEVKAPMTICILNISKTEFFPFKFTISCSLNI